MPIQVFGGGAVQVAFPSLSNLDITNNSITLVWPTSYFNVPSVVDGVHYDVLATNIFVTDGVANTNTITLPNATESSNGASFIMTNIGASSFRLLKSDGSELIVIPSTLTANSFYVVLTDNSTSEGTWEFLQFGAGTSQAVASALAGNGLVALGGLLNTNMVVNPIAAAPYDVIVSDRAKLLLWQTGSGNVDLPLINTIPSGFYFALNNAGTGTATIVPPDTTIQNNASLTVSPTQSLIVMSDGVKWWTLGFGQNIAESNFAPGSAIEPSITFTNDDTTGIYYFNPQGIGFSVGATQIGHFFPGGFYMNAGKNITLQDSTAVSETKVTSNVAYGQLSWRGPGLLADATLNLSGTNTSTTMTLGPFAGFSISETAANATMNYNALTILTINNAGASIFPLDVTFSNTTAFTLKATFNGLAEFNGSVTFNEPVSFLDTVTFNPAIPITSGGTGAQTQQDAINNLVPSNDPGDIFYVDASGDVSGLSIGTVGQVLTVVDIGGGVLQPRWV